MAAVYDTYPPVITVTEGFMIRQETTLEIGNAELWGSLDIISYPYLVYDASVGLQQNAGWQVGACDDIDFERSEDITTVEIGNVLDSGLFEIESEETNVSFGAREWKPDVLGLAFGTTVTPLGSGKDSIIMFGGGCNITSRPVVVRGANVSCNATAITDLTDGVDYFTLTLYDCYTVEGVTLNFRIREDAPIPIAMRAKPVLSLTRGRRTGNLYIATD